MCGALKAADGVGDDAAAAAWAVREWGRVAKVECVGKVVCVGEGGPRAKVVERTVDGMMMVVGDDGGGMLTLLLLLLLRLRPEAALLSIEPAADRPSCTEQEKNGRLILSTSPLILVYHQVTPGLLYSSTELDAHVATSSV